MDHPDTRDTLFVEEAVILQNQALPGGQRLLRLTADAVARRARAGNFIHLRCHPDLPMRRPMSIMRADAQGGWVEILFKVHGVGTEKLAAAQVDDSLSAIGPIGAPFKQRGYRPAPLLIGGGVGIPPMVFLADHLRRMEGKQARPVRPFVVMGSEIPFPFAPRPSRILVDSLPAGVIACMPLLEDWGIASRLASLQGYEGCHDGLVTDLARRWLESMDAPRREQVEIFSCGPAPMLRAAARLAQEFSLPCQVCLEEYMACAVGGCAGCAVPVYKNGAMAMRRVCVDGPVFAGEEIYPAGLEAAG